MRLLPRLRDRAGLSRHRLFRAVLPLALGLFCPHCLAAGNPPEAKCPPATRTDNAKDTYGSTVVADPYRWLEDQNSEETRSWLDSEQKCTEAALSKLSGRPELTARLTELMQTDKFEAPIERGGRYFFMKKVARQDLKQLFVRRTKDGPDELLIDPLPWSQDHSASVTLENVSLDGRYVFYGRREGGQDEITLHVLDVDTGKTLPDTFPSAVYYSVVATPDNHGMYYTTKPPQGGKASYHQMGSDPSKDPLIYGSDFTPDTGVVVDLSEDGQYLVYVVLHGSAGKTDIYVQNVKQHGPVIAAISGEDVISYPNIAGDQLFILTNWKAPKWRIFSTSLAAPGRENWREVVPETDARLENFAAVGGKVVAQYTREATSQLKVFDRDGKNGTSLALPELGTVGAILGRWKSPELFYSFETYDYAPAVFRHDLASGKSGIWAKDSVKIDSSAFEIEQAWYESKDKTRVPMFLFHKKGLKLDGQNPVLLSGYGGFNVSETPSYGPSALVWAERGGIFAEPNLRGGGEFGEDWHRAGMFGNKQNVFDDFLAAAQYLIDKHYTNPSQLAITGGSNGGLLVGAALTQRPDLFRAVVCAYPLLDMLRYQKFLDGPLWVSEYGSAENPDQFPYLYAYSPYQHVVDGKKYPSVLFVTGDGDTRVAPLHARKMAARLQAAGSSRPVLLLYDTKSGHSGGRPIKKEIEERTDTLSYLFWQLGVAASAKN
jgi:prolyl oligopeptidase